MQLALFAQMVFDLFAQVDRNNDAYQAGRNVGIFIAVIICASIPISFGFKNNQPLLGIIGGVFAIPAAILLGCVGGLPVAFLFVGIIAVVDSGWAEGNSQPRRRKKKRKRRRDEEDEDDFDDDDRERRRNDYNNHRRGLD